MADYGTIKIPIEDYERHNERRKELGLTWAGYIDGQAPTDERTVMLEATEYAKIADEVEARLR